MRQKRENDKLKAMLTEHKAQQDQKREDERNKFLTVRLRSKFLQLTSITRQRIRAMEQSGNPTPKTEKALAKRYELLARYEKAYARQQELLLEGTTPPDLVDMV